jgi:hypothetical protein
MTSAADLLSNQDAMSTLTNAIQPAAPAQTGGGLPPAIGGSQSMDFSGLQSILAPYQQKIAANNQEIKKTSNEIESIPHRQAPAMQPVPQQNPLQEQAQDPDSLFSVFKNFGPILASLGSLKSRQPLTAALKSATGMIQGYHQGQTEAAEAHQKAWKEQVDAAMKQNQQELEQYRAVLEDDRLTMEEKQAKITGLMAANRDEIGQATLEAKGFDGWQKTLELRQSAQEKYQAAKDKEEADKLTPEELDIYSDQILSGDRSPYTGLGRNKEAMEQLRKAVADKAAKQGITGEELANRGLAFTGAHSAETTLGHRQGNLETSVEELKNFIPQANEAYSKLDRSNLVPFNQLEQLVQNKTASPEQARAYAADMAVVNAYATVAGRGTPSVDGANRAKEVLNTNMGPEAHAAALDQIMKEATAAAKAPEQAGKNIRDGITGSSGGKTANSPGNTPPVSAFGGKKYATFSNGQTWMLDDSGTPVQVK